MAAKLYVMDPDFNVEFVAAFASEQEATLSARQHALNHAETVSKSVCEDDEEVNNDDQFFLTVVPVVNKAGRERVRDASKMDFDVEDVVSMYYAGPQFDILETGIIYFVVH